jgi:hypothetical protein
MIDVTDVVLWDGKHPNFLLKFVTGQSEELIGTAINVCLVE